MMSATEDKRLMVRVGSVWHLVRRRAEQQMACGREYTRRDKLTFKEVQPEDLVCPECVENDPRIFG